MDGVIICKYSDKSCMLQGVSESCICEYIYELWYVHVPRFVLGQNTQLSVALPIYVKLNKFDSFFILYGGPCGTIVSFLKNHADTKILEKKSLFLYIFIA